MLPAAIASGYSARKVSSFRFRKSLAISGCSLQERQFNLLFMTGPLCVFLPKMSADTAGHTRIRFLLIVSGSFLHHHNAVNNQQIPITLNSTKLCMAALQHSLTWPNRADGAERSDSLFCRVHPSGRLAYSARTKDPCGTAATPCIGCLIHWVAGYGESPTLTTRCRRPETSRPETRRKTPNGNPDRRLVIQRCHANRRPRPILIPRGNRLAPDRRFTRCCTQGSQDAQLRRLAERTTPTRRQAI